jgi:excisionase family DNA binding protein
VTAGDAMIRAIAEEVVYQLQQIQNARQRLLTLEQACEYLGMGETQVRNLIAEGRIKASVIDKRVRIDRCELDRLIENTKRPG